MKHQRIKKITSLSVSIIILFSLCIVGCKNDSSPDINSVVFIDALGRQVSVQKNPQRVAALLGSFADVWQLAGGTVCATANDAWDDFGLELNDAINIGGAHSPSLELLISSNPDFVLASSSTSSNTDMKDTLESMGITVAYFDVDNFEDYIDMLDTCTDITGRKDLYKQNGLALQTQIETIKANYQNSDIPQNQRTVLLLRATSSTVKAKSSKGTILGEMLEDMGCINIADSDTSLLENLSVEAIIKKEPYHIFAVTMGSNTEAAKASIENMIKDNAAWRTLDAIQNNRLHIMDKVLFNLKPNARWAEAYLKLYETLTEK